jgi:ATP-binding cassette subfamily B protein
MEKLFNLLDQNKEIADKDNAPALQLHGQGSPDVVFQQVNFSYEEKRQILFDVDFKIAAGTTTAVVGHSGSGKSTLSRLLFRFYDIQSGSIQIGGQNIMDITQHSLRQAIGIVPQDTVLFNDTIGYNIAYGQPGATHDSLPEGYETMVGERGLKLSGGEKQRVAIARTLLKNPVVMIFDEATSALDSKSEQMIQAQLKQIAKSRTSLVIAHRLSTIVDAQQILVMDKGRIIERGTHPELMAMAGAYAQMWERQQHHGDGSLSADDA